LKRLSLKLSCNSTKKALKEFFVIKMRFVCCLAVLLVLVNFAKATVNTYPSLAENLYKSSRYNVSVTQSGNTYDSYVYNSVNTYNDPWGSRPLMTDDNNFTSFSFDETVVVDVTLPQRTTAITSVEILPKIKGVIATWSGNTISIPISAPGNYYVRINGEEKNPLFIFANPLEINAPASGSDPNVLYITPVTFTKNFSSNKSIWYFAPGIYDAGMSGGTLQNIPSGTTVYLAGGAYLKGLLKASASATNLTIRGRGILSGIDVANIPDLWGNFMVDGWIATALTMEGIIITDAPSQHIQAYASGSTFDNIKLLAWYIMTDSFTHGINSTVKNCFIKVNDDCLKPMNANSIYKDNVVWIQAIGSALQFGWNMKPDNLTTNIRIDGLDIIGCDKANISGTATNISIVSFQNIAGANYTGITVQNVRSDVKVYKIFEMQIKSTQPGFTQGLGTINGITFKNFSFPMSAQLKSTFKGNGTQTGEIKNVTFENVKIGGTLLTESNETTYLTRSGLTSNFYYGPNSGSSELLLNGTFENGITPWTVELHGGAAATIEPISQIGYSGNACKTIITNSGTANWHVQVQQVVPITSGKTYSVTFKASATAPRTMQIVFQQSVSPYTDYWSSETINLTTSPSTYGPYTFVSNTTDPTQKFRFFLGNNNSEVFIDDVVITSSDITSTIGEKLVRESSLKVYPNPANACITIDFGNNFNNEQVRVLLVDLSGKIVFKSVVSNISNFQILTSEFAKGPYFLNVISDSEMITSKIIIQ
jgi:hypothetical protein